LAPTRLAPVTRTINISLDIEGARVSPSAPLIVSRVFPENVKTLNSCFDAFSSPEAVSTSLENAMEFLF
jgi:hypothetical protein